MVRFSKIKINLKINLNVIHRKRGFEISSIVPLKDLLRECELNYFDEKKFNETNFPTVSIKDLPLKLTTRLFHYKKEISTEEIIKNMNQRGYRPATLYELLFFLLRYPNSVKKFWPVAFGSKFHNPDDGVAAVPVIVFLDEGVKTLSLRDWNSLWSQNRYFLGIRKLSKTPL